MADTAVDKVQVDQQAQNHLDFKSHVETILNNLEMEVDSLLKNSHSEATQALEKTTDGWIHGIKSAVTTKLEEMAGNIKSAAKNQTERDEQNRDMMSGISTDSSSFLHG